MKLKPIERTPAYEAVRDRLVELIQQGAIAVGEKLPAEGELAESLAVSRPVLREALGQLRAMGVIRSEPGRGTFVVSTGAQPPVLLGGGYTPTHLHEVRMLLETAAVGSAARRCSDEQLREIEAALNLIDSSADPSDYAAHDVAFHLAVGKASGNPVLELVLKQLQELIGEEVAYLAETDEWRRQAISDHREILRAISARDGSAAERAMRAHLQKVQHQFLGRVAVGFSGPSHRAQLRPQAKPQPEPRAGFVPQQHPAASTVPSPPPSPSGQESRSEGRQAKVQGLADDKKEG